jgi:uncharacterized protein YlaN (UPF0358 family)
MKNKKIVGWIPRILFRIYITLKEKFDPSIPITKQDEICAKICLKLLDYPETELTINTFGDQRFIKNETHDIIISISHGHIRLINHVYGYNITIGNDGLYDKILKKFDEVLDNKLKGIEKEIDTNIENSLGIILEKVSPKITELNYEKKLSP